MGLTIDRRVHTRRKVVLTSTWVIGIIGMIAAPLSIVSAVRSPSQEMATKVRQSVKSKKSTEALKVDTKQRAPNKAAGIPASADCASGRAMHPGLVTTQSSQLQKLTQYEQVCKSAITSTVSFFVPTPTTPQQAREYAVDTISQLQEFSRNGIAPLVFFEPTTPNGLVDLASYKAGAYDEVLDTYFATIKAAGLTDAMMGMWVPIPEGNIPVWSSVSPADFAGSVTKAVTFQKKYFPTSKSSIMLDNQSYPRAGSWDDGRAVSLTPYLQNIPAGLIDSFGLQGFPWSPAGNENGSTNGSPRNYLRSDLAVEAARTLRVQEIWLNTGTFGVKYANQPGRQVTIAPTQRLEQLSGVLVGAKTIKSQGFTVSIHLFAEDKSRVAEATDWSYWPNGNTSASPTIDIFKSFVNDLRTSNIPLWLFDTN